MTIFCKKTFDDAREKAVEHPRVNLTLINRFFQLAKGEAKGSRDGVGRAVWLHETFRIDLVWWFWTDRLYGKQSLIRRLNITSQNHGRIVLMTFNMFNIGLNLLDEQRLVRGSEDDLFIASLL